MEFEKRVQKDRVLQQKEAQQKKLGLVNGLKMWGRGKRHAPMGLVKAANPPIKANFFVKGWAERLLQDIHPRHRGDPIVSVDDVPENKSPFANGYAFGRALVKRGFVKLGGGMFSTVMAKPGSARAVKVCHRPDGWADYVHWAQEAGWGGKYAPKVYSFKFFKARKKGEKDFYVAVMERLDHTLRDVPYKENPHFTTTLVSHVMNYANDNAKICLDLVAPGMGEFTGQFKAKFEDRGLDMHNGNWMMRKDTLVLTDPLAGSMSESVPKRFRSQELLAA